MRGRSQSRHKLEAAYKIEWYSLTLLTGGTMLKKQSLCVIQALLIYLTLCNTQWQNIPHGQLIQRRPVQTQREFTQPQDPLQLQTTLQRNPSRSEETKKFSTSQRCQVEEFDRVPCGEMDITGAECEAINCCYDGRQCFYGLSGDLKCYHVLLNSSQVAHYFVITTL